MSAQLLDAGAKFCSGCKHQLPTTMFGRAASKPMGLKSRCRVCVKAAKRLSGKARRDAAVLACPVCFTEFQAYTDSGAPRKYCSRRCGLRAANMRRVYGLSTADYHALLIRAEHSCEACGVRFADYDGTFETSLGRGGPLAPARQPMIPHIDHSHVTGEVRGLLCSSCNHKVGRYESNKQLAESYLAKVEKRRIS